MIKPMWKLKMLWMIKRWGVGVVWGVCILLVISSCTSQPTTPEPAKPVQPSPTVVPSTPIPVTTVRQPDSDLSLEDQYEQMCEEAYIRDATGQKAEGIPWFYDDRGYPNPFLSKLHENAALTPNQAQVLVCTRTDFVSLMECPQENSSFTFWIQREELTIAFIDIASRQVLQNQTFLGYTPDSCPASRPSIGSGAVEKDEAERWALANWSLGPAMVGRVSFTPIPQTSGDLGNEQVNAFMDSVCTHALDSKPANETARGGVWVSHNFDFEFDDEIVPADMLAGSPMEAQVVLCMEREEEVVQECKYTGVPSKTVNLSKIFYTLYYVDLQSETTITKSSPLTGEAPSSCPFSINTIDGVILAPGEREKFEGRPDDYEITGWLLRNWQSGQEIPAPKYQFFAHGPLEGLGVGMLVEDSNGTLNVATSNGLMGFQSNVDPTVWLVASQATGLLPYQAVAGVAPSSQGIWILPAEPGQPVYLMKQGSTAPVAGMPAVTVIKEDQSGKIWTDLGIWNGEAIEPLLDETGQPFTDIHSILIDGEAVWVGNRQKLVRYEDGQPVKTIDMTENFEVLAWSLYGEDTVLAGGDQQFATLDLQGAMTLQPDVYGLVLSIDTAGKDIWLATLQEGLFHFDGSQWEHINRLDGLPRDGGLAILIDAQGTVWLGGDGLVSILPGE